MNPLIHRFWWRIYGVLVYALVGTSGSGKSHRARLVASKYNIPLIIDDGLLIQGEKIIAGKSAKNEANYLKAIKRAVFEDPTHRREIVAALETLKFKRILLIGTSLKMVRRLAYRLDLPKIYKVIRIEEIATAEEIANAKLNRSKGRHIIPVPVQEVSRHQGPLFLEPLQIQSPNRLMIFKNHEVYNKTVILPGFHKASPSLDPKGLRVLIFGWIADLDPNLPLSSIEIEKNDGSLKISLYFGTGFGLNWYDKIQQIQDFLKEHLAQYDGWDKEKSEILIFFSKSEELT